MASFTQESLVAAAGVDPWALRDQFTAGDPEEIYALARAFNTAAAQQGDSVTLTTKGLETAGDGYKVNNHTPIDVSAEVAATSRSLGNSGEKLGKIAKLLSTTASDLSVRTSTAKGQVTSLESDVNAIIREWNGVVQQNHHDPDFQRDHESVMQPYVQRAVQKVKDYGNPIKQSVTDYEKALTDHLKSMADLGYIPADSLDEGPGDIDLSPAAARADAGKVNAAVNGDPSKAGLAGIQDGSRTIALLNEKIAAGYKLTPAERAYMDAWYNAVGADNLARIPAYVRKAAPFAADNRRGPDGSPTMSPDDVYRSVVTPIANGIMNLSNPRVGGHATTAEMPQAIQDLVNQRVGYVDPDTGIRWPNKNFLSTYGEDATTAAQRAVDGGVDGLGRYTGFADLLATADTTGGDAFTKDLAASAVRVKQDLNTAQAEAKWSLYNQYGGRSPEVTAKLAHMFTDAAPSEMLQVVGHNHSASADVLLDQHLRQEVMGLNWDDETGAANVLHSGTERDPHNGGGTEKQARAALAVIQEVGSDRDGYLSRMGEQVEDSVKDIGTEYIDSFARDPAGQSGYRTDLKDPLGRGVGPSFQLDSADRDHFLQFISGTGDDDATDFQAKATAYSEVMLADAFKHGSPAQVQEALHQAGTLDGAVTQANFDYTFDHTDAADKEAAAAARAASLHHIALKTGISLGTTIIGTGVTLASGGTLGPVVGITSAVINAGATFAFADDPAPGADLPRTRDELLHADHEDYAVRRDYLVLQAAVDGGVVDPSTLPSGLTTTDASGHVVLRPPGDLDDSQVRSDLRVSSTQAINTYEAGHRTPGDSGDVDELAYDNARGNVADGTWDHDNPRNSPWSGDHSRDLSYGDNKIPFQGYPDDPRKLNDPNYNPFHPDK
jgi:uncharacterized protein YukE